MRKERFGSNLAFLVKFSLLLAYKCLEIEIVSRLKVVSSSSLSFPGAACGEYLDGLVRGDRELRPP